MSDQFKFNATNIALRREEFQDKTLPEIQSRMEQDMVDFSDVLASIEDTQELKRIEDLLMEVFKEDDAHLKEVTYSLEDKVEYDGNIIKRSEILNKIIAFINRLEVNFRATLGIYQAIRYWKTKGADPVPYAVFDSTLRMLDTLKFKGETDCFDILVVNNWFAGAHEAYARDNVYTQYLSTKHQAILDRMDQIEKKNHPQEEAEENNQ